MLSPDVCSCVSGAAPPSYFSASRMSGTTLACCTTVCSAPANSPATSADRRYLTIMGNPWLVAGEAIGVAHIMGGVVQHRRMRKAGSENQERAEKQGENACYETIGNRSGIGGNYRMS